MIIIDSQGVVKDGWAIPPTRDIVFAKETSELDYAANHVLVNTIVTHEKSEHFHEVMVPLNASRGDFFDQLKQVGAECGIIWTHSHIRDR
mmetsp:Transcript_36530/g.87108  ORF Transcript_36530/g.87108 Transcript_36530/m.87108 type:complete len:90 (-) Transcript_36530:1438-1707(-)